MFGFPKNGAEPRFKVWGWLHREANHRVKGFSFVCLDEDDCVLNAGIGSKPGLLQFSQNFFRSQFVESY